MIYGIGVDLVHIGRMKTVIERWGDRFLKRVFTEGERESLQREKEDSAAAGPTRLRPLP